MERERGEGHKGEMGECVLRREGERTQLKKRRQSAEIKARERPHTPEGAVTEVNKVIILVKLQIVLYKVL